MNKYFSWIPWDWVGAIALLAFAAVMVTGLFFALLEATFRQIEKAIDRSRDATLSVTRLFRRSRLPNGSNSSSLEPTPEEVFFKTLRTAIEFGTIKTLVDAENIYLGTPRLRFKANRLRESLAASLQHYLVLLHAGSDHEQMADHAAHVERVSILIESCKEGAPYDGLPDKEKNIIVDMMTFLKAGDADAALRKLPELTSAIEARENTFARIAQVNRYAMPIAFASALSAIIGLASALYQMGQ